jgi:hypothetical protein
VTCPDCPRPTRPGCSPVELLAGGTVCSWSADWLTETRERHTLALRILALPDKEARHARLASLEASYPDTRVGALARERLEAEALSVWQSRRAVALGK